MNSVQAGNEQTEHVLKIITDSAMYFLVHTIVDGHYLMRFVPGSRLTSLADIEACWAALQAAATTVVGE